MDRVVGSDRRLPRDYGIKAAIEQQPFERITLRPGMRVIREHYEEWRPEAAEAHSRKRNEPGT